MLFRSVSRRVVSFFVAFDLFCCWFVGTQGFTDYVFGDVCTAIYNFLYYELFGVYLEAIKPVVRGDDAGAITLIVPSPLTFVLL